MTVRPPRLTNRAPILSEGFRDCVALVSWTGLAEFTPASADPSLGARLGQPGGGPLSDHGALELGEGTDHLHHHPTCSRDGVDRLGKRSKVGSSGLDPPHDVKEVLQAARQAVTTTTSPSRNWPTIS